MLERHLHFIKAEDFASLLIEGATALERDFGFTPKITLREGLRAFAQWYKSYYNPAFEHTGQI